MRFVDDDEVVISPIQCFQVDVSGITSVPAEIGVGKYVVTVTIGKKRIEATVRRKENQGARCGPVFPLARRMRRS